MEKTYDPQTIENRWYQTWEKNHYFNPSAGDTPYCIMLPPPNITGSLHMGHGFQQTLMDALIRYHRMRGEDTLWQVGTDHASIATELVVERQLAQQHQSRHTLGRDPFIEKVWAWKQESGSTISRQMRRLGLSAAWDREKFTLDEDISHAVREVFIRLFNEELIYRDQRLVNWDPHFLTAISDLEVIAEETKGELWYIRYLIATGAGHLTVATTRPETLLGDVAVAVHPLDERYQHLIGEQLKLPLTDRTIPIIGDDSIDPAFGTGCVKITPAHDFNDYAIGQRHQLPRINIFTPDAHLNENVPLVYRGLERIAARKKILADLTAQNLLEKTEPHVLKIPRGDRSGAIIEPYLTDQWFVRMAPLAEPAIKAVENGDVRFVPDNWNKTYFQWLHNIQDWCISRQLWWGHRIPVWYDDTGKAYVGHNEQEIRQQNQISGELRQDEDVLDTWFSAALWPFATLGWPQQTPEYQHYYPTNVLVTGFDIIFFWVARMIMMGLKFTQQVPFREVYITGLIRDHEGHKMSKSKGNVLDPIDLIDGIELEPLLQKRTQGLMQPQMAKRISEATVKQFPQGIPAFGTDALRFTYCALASTGRDIRFDLGRVEGYRNFCNKLWNAARFVLMNTEQTPPTLAAEKTELTLADRWIVSRLQQTIQEVRRHFDDYRFDLLAQALYEFTWNEYCDWYLELAKPMLGANSDPAQQNNTRYILLMVLETVLRLLHPLMPFITEEIWQRVAPLLGKQISKQTGNQDATIMLQPYPQFDPDKIDVAAENELRWLQNVILGLRNIRGEMRINPGQTIPLICAKGTAEDRARVQQHQAYICTLAKISNISWLAENAAEPAAAMALVDQLHLLIPLAGLIDVNAETSRINKELAKLKTEFDRASQKLANPSFVANAPAEVVTQERARLAEWQAAIEKLGVQLEKLNAVS